MVKSRVGKGVGAVKRSRKEDGGHMHRWVSLAGVKGRRVMKTNLAVCESCGMLKVGRNTVILQEEVTVRRNAHGKVFLQASDTAMGGGQLILRTVDTSAGGPDAGATDVTDGEPIIVTGTDNTGSIGRDGLAWRQVVTGTE